MTVVLDRRLSVAGDCAASLDAGRDGQQGSTER